VRVTEDRGRVLTAPGFGLLQDDPEIEHPATRITEVDAEGASEQIDFEGIDVPIEPVIGTIGAATAEGSVSTLTPDDHGGNLDTTDMTTGTTAYFPVFQEGAMLAMGDSKAAMADGEMCGTGAEIGTEIDVTLSVIEDPEISLDRPLVDTGDAVKTIASAETMEEAVELANRDVVRLLAHEHGFSRTEAYLFSRRRPRNKSSGRPAGDRAERGAERVSVGSVLIGLSCDRFLFPTGFSSRPVSLPDRLLVDGVPARSAIFRAASLRWLVG